MAKLPKLIATSVVRGSQKGQSHGGVYVIDFDSQTVEQKVDWNTGEIDFTGRGWDRGLRGIELSAREVPNYLEVLIMQTLLLSASVPLNLLRFQNG